MARLHTARLVLRPITHDDVDAFAEVCADVRVMRHIGDGQPLGWEACVRTVERLERQWAEQGRGWWAATLHERVVGWVGFRAEPYLGVPEMGWTFAAQVWGRGLATEAAGAALEYGFLHLGYGVVNALIRPANDTSQRLAARLGFAHMGAVEVGGVVQEWYTRRAP